MAFLLQGLTNAGVALEKSQRDEEARHIYAFAMHRFKDNPTELAKAHGMYAGVVQKLGGLNFNAGRLFSLLLEFISNINEATIIKNRRKTSAVTCVCMLFSYGLFNWNLSSLLVSKDLLFL
jgi:hypothetical protein